MSAFFSFFAKKFPLAADFYTMKKNLLFIFSCWLVLGWSQTVHYEQFGLKNQLPSHQINSIYQDRLGQLWIGTQAGLLKYNSYQFERVYDSNGAYDQSITDLYEDQKGRIWLFKKGGLAGVWQNNQIQPHLAQNSIAKLLQNRQIASFEVDIDDKIYFSIQNQPPFLPDFSIYTLDAKNEPQTLPINPPQLGVFLAQKSIIFNRRPFLVGNQIDPKPQKLNPKLEGKFISLAQEAQNCHCAFAPTGRTMACANEKYITQFDETGIVLSVDSFDKKVPTIFGVSYDKQNNLWIATQSGAFMWEKANTRQTPTVYFPHFAIKQILQDREGNYWLATQAEGLIFLPYLHLRLHLVSAYPYQNHIRKLLYINGFVQALSSEGLVYKVSPNTVFPTYYNQNASPALNWFYLPQRQQILLSNGLTLDANTGTAFLNWWDNEDFKPECFAQAENNQIILGNRYGFLIFDLLRKNAVWNSQTVDFNESVFDIKAQSNNRFWLATSGGLYEYNPANNQISPINLPNTLQDKTILQISQTAENLLILSTASEGILYQNREKKWAQLSEKQGLATDAIYKILVQNDSVWWAATNKGLEKIVWRNGQNSPEISHYSVYNGLPSNGINDILQTPDGKIWLATEAGIVFFEPNQLQQQEAAAPLVSIQKVSINGTETLIKQAYDLEYWQQNVEISFLAVRFRNAGAVNYRYRLEGKDKDWQYTNNRSIQYTNLQAGTYTFWVSAQGENGNWPQTAQVMFVISPPFWWAWWFWAAIFIVLTLIFWAYVRYLKGKTALQQKVWASEQNALRAQMNPHFIFNAMNSILYFVRLNDKRQATSFLASFSSLIRRILDNSKQPLITLQDEIETMQKYLELEKLRLSNPEDDFRIETAPEIVPADWKLPPMLIQPLLENAIMHGLAPKTEGQRSLLLKFERDKQFLKITVQDNGIGRAAATEIQKRRSANHNSYGTRNIDERLKLLNQIYKKAIKIEIQDLFDTEKQPAGTKICLRIPNFL